MDGKLVLALVAAASAVVGGLITGVLGPVIKHRLEQASAKETRRREQIQRWREMILQIDRECDGNIDVGRTIQLHSEYLSLEPHLSEETRRSVYGENRTLVVGQSLAEPLENLKRDIERVENGWHLR